uniref:Uncharacterized protein n=1 Tax=Rhizophora mucronata TaxID=61149 RepID=A0A2P2Q8I7_RHIMU
MQILKHKLSLLEARNADLQRKFHEHQVTCEHLIERAITAQVDKRHCLLLLLVPWFLWQLNCQKQKNVNMAVVARDVGTKCSLLLTQKI